jgi:hypothetical protein
MEKLERVEIAGVHSWREITPELMMRLYYFNCLEFGSLGTDLNKHLDN